MAKDNRTMGLIRRFHEIRKNTTFPVRWLADNINLKLGKAISPVIDRDLGQRLSCIKIILVNEKIPFIYKICRTQVRSINGSIQSAAHILEKRGINVSYTINPGDSKKVYTAYAICHIDKIPCSTALNHKMKIIYRGQYNDWYRRVEKFTRGRHSRSLPNYFLPDDEKLYVDDKGAWQLLNDALSICLLREYKAPG